MIKARCQCGEILTANSVQRNSPQSHIYCGRCDTALSGWSVHPLIELPDGRQVFLNHPYVTTSSTHWNTEGTHWKFSEFIFQLSSEMDRIGR